MMRRPFSLLLFLFLLYSSSYSDLSATSPGDYRQKSDLQAHYQQAKFFYNQLKNSDKLGASRENWLKGAGNFRRIYLAEPRSELAPACLFMLGRLYFDLYESFGLEVDRSEAISYYRDVDTLFPGNRLADDALYAVGVMLLEEVKDPEQAAKSFTRIVSGYPDGDMRSKAETRLKVLSQEFDIPLPEAMISSTEIMRLTNVLPVQHWSSRDYTRVVVRTSSPTTYQEKLLEEVGNRPRRLYIDFQNSYIEPRFRSPIPIEDGLLKRIRTGQFSPDTVRVVLDIESISDYKIFSLPDPFRVIIDVRGKPQAEPAVSFRPLVPPPPPQPPPAEPAVTAEAEAATETATDPPSSAPPSAEEVKQERIAVVADPGEAETGPLVVLRETRKVAARQQAVAAGPVDRSALDPPAPQLSLAQQLSLGVGTIVIDPGHGGRDPGAIAFGMKEKDIVLKMAKSLAAHLRDDLNARVILTREDDRFLPLEERTAIANTNNADLFISLHINAHPSPEVKGFETYFLNLSTNAEAMRVAARENATSTHQMSDLEDILSDILQNSKINESSRLARQVHGSLGTGLAEPPFALKDMGVKQAPFYVLIGAEMPAILLEVAFISNPGDARLLGDDGFIDHMARQIAGGIGQYAGTNTASL